MMVFSRKDVMILFLSLFFTSSLAQNCPAYTFSSNAQYTTCNTLPVLSSFLHWNYHPANNSIDVAYRHTGVTASNWVVWSINPTGTRMVGSQCLVALFNSTSTVPRAYTSPVTSYITQLQEAPLSFSVSPSSLRAEFISGQMIIYATITLPAGRTSFPHVWQHGDVSSSGVPQSHIMTQGHTSSFATIDFATGASTNTGAGSGGSRQRRRNVHGVLNVVSWGIMMPLGAIAARYLKVFKSANPAWFYIHVSCQASAYIVGVAGWGTGLRLGSDSPGIEHTVHRNIGITLFVFGTLQAFAILLRPKPDHKYRIYWNAYHHAIGYAVISLSIANIFEGLDILDPEERWRRAYIGVLIAMGVVAVCLEAFTWFVVIKRKRETSKQPNGVNGYEA